jgi:hypothetical protein
MADWASWMNRILSDRRAAIRADLEGETGLPLAGRYKLAIDATPAFLPLYSVMSEVISSPVYIDEFVRSLMDGDPAQFEKISDRDKSDLAVLLAEKSEMEQLVRPLLLPLAKNQPKEIGTAKISNSGALESANDSTSTRQTSP